MEYRNQVLCGDALEILRGLPDNIVQCVVTSPPYYNLRDNNHPDQLGMEPTPELYVARLVEIFREVRRILRKDGVCWVNLGDTFSGSGKGHGTDHGKLGKHANEFLPAPIDLPNIAPKNLLGIPWHVAFALQDDGWTLRSEIIWHKSNAMPESVKDRPTKSHEQIFLLAKSERYYYDATAILEPVKYPNRTYSPATERHKTRTLARQGNRTTGGLHDGRTSYVNPAGKNKRSVWSVPTVAYRGAHFSTFPPKLVEPMILAGSSPKACEKCGAPWKRGKEKADWQPTCKCTDAKGTGHCLILDPFAGAGTTLYVALLHSRDFLGIELNPSYINLIMKRIRKVQPHLWDAIA